MSEIDSAIKLDALRRLMNALETVDVVPVVRCKDCKWWDVDSDGIFCEYGRVPKDDWFCADGERKDDGKTAD